MAGVLGVIASTVMRHWHVHGLKPHLVRGFKASRDPSFVEKLEDIVGLYMSLPEHALDRTQPGLPLKKGGHSPWPTTEHVRNFVHEA